jgi:GntR family transcriptional regulator/MocR family aminotransferase
MGTIPRVRIPLDRSATVPLWRQIERFLRVEIESGALQPGTRIPSTRALATDLAVSRVTVDSAYMALATDGLIVAHPGSGTVVAQSVNDRGATADASHPWPAWQHAFEAVTRAAPAEPLDGADIVSFTGVGDPALFPTREIAVTIADVIRTEAAGAFAYSHPDLGHPPLRATVTHLLASQGIHTSPDRVLITSGSQQALFLVCHALLEHGDTVIVERPTYDGALALFAAIGVRVVGIEVDADGMRVDDLEAAITAHRPKLIYTIPTFQNPTGACMSGPRRHRLLELARAHQVPVLEDDFVGDLRYDGHVQPALKAIDTGGDVLYAGTFSKMLMPGVRVGYLVADGPVLDHVAGLKKAMDLSTSLLMQRVLDRYVTVGRYQTHLRRSIRIYRARRDTLVSAVAREIPSIEMNAPRGGLFAWATLPAGVGATALRIAARRRGADFAPGTLFFDDARAGERHVRLNFAVHDHARIELGVRRLAMALADVLGPSST